MAIFNTRKLIHVFFLIITVFFYGFCIQSKRETKSVLLDQSLCPLSWQPADEFCVRLFFQPTSSEDAKQECQLHGAELVNIVKNQQENSALINDLSEIINEPVSAGVTELTWLVGGIDAVVKDVQLSYNLWLSAKSEDQQEKSLALQLKNNRHFELTTVSTKSAYPFICSLLPLARKTLLYEQALYPKGSPQIVEQPKLAYHYSPRRDGYFVTIPCKSSGNPVPKINWFKNGIDEIDVSSTNSSFIVSGGSLLVPIHNNSTESFEYHCTATNIHGTYRSSSTIVRSAFIEPFRATRLDVYANRKTSGTKIECQTPQHYPKPI
uniref:Ig-like domain-containing protein n=1 Tax=Panagrolaimus sp. JU765 TaxID=591449 RepID=A0AC34QHX6_9BILA